LTGGQRWMVVVDTETTGLPGDPWAELVEIGAVVLDDEGDEIGAFSSLLRPSFPPPVEADPAFAVNGLTRALLSRAPDRAAVLLAFRAWLAAYEHPPATAWPVVFEQHFLAGLGLRWTSCLQRAGTAVMKVRGAFTPSTRSDGTRREHASLAVAADHFGVVPTGPTHRALVDARIAAGILRGIRAFCADP
jgi:DNA polymerase III epsilon subunit-like protein